MNNIKIELPRLKIPIYLIIDDGTALHLNDLITWNKNELPELAQHRFAENQFKGKTKYTEWERFIREFVEVVHKNNIKGKFTVIPYVKDIGMLDNIPKDCLQKSLIDDFIEIVKKDIMKNFDITPEIITHDNVYDIRTGKFLKEKEWIWCDKQTAETLEKYIRFALKVLKNSGLEPNGVTSPCDFGIRVEDKYITAIRKSIKKVCGSSFAWYFLSSSPNGFPRIMYFDRLKKEIVMSVVSVNLDITVRKIYGDDIDINSDFYLSKDAKKGYFRDLFDIDSPIPICMHWWTIYSNGKYTGLKILDEISKRANNLFNDKIIWMKCSDFARYYAVRYTCIINLLKLEKFFKITIESAFFCKDLTISFDYSKNIKRIRIIDNNKTKILKRVNNRSLLCSNTWLKESNKVFLCFDIENKIEIIVE